FGRGIGGRGPGFRGRKRVGAGVIPDPAELGAEGPATPDEAHRARPVPWSLLPDSAAIGEDGWLALGGCSTAALAAEFGTPLFVYDEHHLRARCREAVAT